MLQNPDWTRIGDCIWPLNSLHPKITVVGLQETRLSVARAVGIGQYLIFAAAANAKGQGGVEFNRLGSLIPVKP